MKAMTGSINVRKREGFLSFLNGIIEFEGICFFEVFEVFEGPWVSEDDVREE